VPPDRPKHGPLQGKAWRDAVKRLQSAQAAARRAKGTTYTRKADRPAGASYSPGMARKMPPPAADGGDEG